MSSTTATPDHYCIQQPRIERIDKKVDVINAKLDKLANIEGPIAQLSQQTTRLTTLIENGDIKGAAARDEDNKPDWWSRLPWLVALGLVGILGALLGTKLPF